MRQNGQPDGALTNEAVARGDAESDRASSAVVTEAARDLLRAIRAGRTGSDSFIVAFEHAGAPASKARARWSGKTRRAFTPDRTAQAQEALAWSFRLAMGGRVLEGNVAIAAVFYRADHRRIDADNLMKLVLDAATKAGVWKDDSQVTAQASVVEFDPKRPRTLVAIGPTDSTLNRGVHSQNRSPKGRNRPRNLPKPAADG